MPTFSSVSLARLATCHPDLQMLFNEVIREFDCVVLEGHRDRERQEAAFAAGNTKLHYPHGQHNQQPSMAVDVAPCPVNWHDTARFHFFGGFVLGVASRLNMRFKLRWGGDWDSDKVLSDERFRDLVHFELRKE